MRKEWKSVNNDGAILVFSKQGCAPDEKTRRVWVSGMGIRKRDLGYEYRPKFSVIGYVYVPNWGQKA
eukprot:scaffold9642_cov97-Skeletonema_menzelii.AAC.3